MDDDTPQTPTHTEIKGLILPMHLVNAVMQIAEANGVNLGVVLNAAITSYVAGKQIESQIVEANRSAIVVPRPHLKIANNGTSGE